MTDKQYIYAIHNGHFLYWDMLGRLRGMEPRNDAGLRWLTGDYRAGDLLTFSMHTAHLGLDNNANRIRLSCDIRYQPASEPADPRWIGADPSAHGSRSKVGVIC